MRGITLIAAFLLCLSGTVRSQQFPLTSQYLINPYSLSPAFAGHTSNYEAFMGYQRNWLGIAGAPEFRQFNLNGPIGSQMGVGGSLDDDRVGIFRRISLNLGYAYHLQVAEGTMISFGVNAGLIDQYIQSTNPASYSDPSLALQQSAEKKHFNAGIGINAQWKNLNAGIALPNLLENKTAVDSASTYTENRAYRFYTMYHWQASSDIAVDPYVVLNSNLTSTIVEISTLVKYKNMIWAGASYQSSGTINIHIGGLPLSFLSMQYSYGLSGSGIMAEASGNHEFSLGFLIGRKESTYTSSFNRKLETRKKGYYKWLDKSGGY